MSHASPPSSTTDASSATTIGTPIGTSIGTTSGSRVATAADVTANNVPPAPAAWYRREPWLLVCLLAFVPLGIAPIVGKPLQTALLWLAGLMLLAGVVLLARQPTPQNRDLSNPSARRGE